ncbi:MAG: DoxX family protein [Gammaproteobacteria bacterium]
MANAITNVISTVIRGADVLSPLINLVIRLWMANIFWKSGLAKIDDWNRTLFLFENVFKVPVFPPHVAAVLATGAELICPVLLVIGLATRLSSAVLIFLTFMAAVSFHLGAVDASTNWNEGYLSHIYFTLLLAVLFFHGAGKVSVDYFIRKRFMN